MVVQVVIAIIKNSGSSLNSTDNLACDLVLDTLLGLLSRSLGLLGHALGLDSVVGIFLLAVGVDLVASVVADEVCEVLDSSRTTVLDGRRLVLGGEELDGGETLDLIGNVVEGSVDLGDGNKRREIGKEFTKLFVLGSETN